MQGLVPRAPSIPLMSTTFGRFVEGAELDVTAWWQNIRQSVLFEGGVRELLQGGPHVFLEVSAHPALSASLTRCIAAAPQSHARSASVVLPSLRRSEPERITLLGSLGQSVHAAAVPWTGRASILPRRSIGPCRCIRGSTSDTGTKPPAPTANASASRCIRCWASGRVRPRPPGKMSLTPTAHRICGIMWCRDGGLSGSRVRGDGVGGGPRNVGRERGRAGRSGVCRGPDAAAG